MRQRNFKAVLKWLEINTRWAEFGIADDIQDDVPSARINQKHKVA